MLVGAIDFGKTSSGWAFSFLHEFMRHPTKVSVKHWHSGSSLITEKAPTIALILQRGEEFELVAFGYDAENQYTTLLGEKESDVGNYYYFKEFKMAFNKILGQVLDRDITIEDSRGRSLPAMKVFSLTIAYLVKDLVSQVENRKPGGIQHDDIHWVLTVPAIWTDSAKQFKMEAAIEAGISKEKLSIVLEPEAASVYCRNIPLDVSSKASGIAEFEVGTKYMVVDAGGGTVDITVYEVQGDGKVKGIHAAGGGGWGGTMVNRAFENMMRDIVSKAEYDNFVKTQTEDWLDLYRDFEIKKKEIGKEDSCTVSIRVPASLGKLIREKNKQDTDYKILSSQYFGSIKLENDKLRIEQKVMEALFNDSISKTVDYMRSILDNDKTEDVHSILMVGGFSDSPLLQKTVRSEFKDKKVLIPGDASSIVLKGAVLLGHKPDAISGRILQYTYGYIVEVPFEEGVHPEDNKVTTDNGVRCKDAFKVYVKRGQIVAFGQEPEKHRIHPSFWTTTGICIPIYVTQSVHIPVVVDERLTEIGKLSVKLEKHDGKFNREIFFSMDFSATTIKVTASDEKTGKTYQASLDFLG